jgi:hypothetical protein
MRTQKTTVGWAGTRRAAAAVAGLAVLASGAAAQEQAPERSRGDSAGARRAVDALVARSDAFRDTVTAQLGEMGFEYARPRRSRIAQRFNGGLTFSVAQPVGEFRRFARAGFGISAAGVAGVDQAGVLGLRVEGGAQNYGRFSAPFQTQSAILGAPGRQVTSNDVYWGAVGPQLTVPLGPVRPYGFATAGIANFATTSRLLGAGITGQGQEFVSSTDLSNWATTQALGGGLRVRLVRQNGTPVHLDLGAQRHYVRSARYLTPGAVPGQTAVSLLSSAGRADFLTYHVGFSVGGR